MKLRCLPAFVLLLFAVGPAFAQNFTDDVIGMHDLSPGSKSPITGARPGSCTYCHAPHSGLATGRALWNQTLSTQVYSPYTSSTYHQKGAQPVLGSDSSLCLSCHDGTVAPGQTIVSGKIMMTGAMNSADILGTNLQSSHPFSLSLPLVDAPDLVQTLASKGQTADPLGKVKLIKGNIECTSCHNPHVQAVDPIAQQFLVRDSSNGEMCLACHDPARTVTGETNPLFGWGTSIHATATNRVATAANAGSYATVGQNACLSCHMPHNGKGPAWLLRGPNEQDCAACHSGGTNISPAAPNIFQEMTKVGHPVPSGNNQHDAGESVLLNQNRHATCADCHDGHAAQSVGSFPPPPVVRLSQDGVTGISATDGVTILNPAVNQYENCLRCHSTSVGKVADPKYGYLPLRAVSALDPLNVIPQFAAISSSSHPVTHASSSPYPQPSLRQQMLNLNGSTFGRTTGTQILCTDCHNSDDDREFGGTGPNGPHGSKWTHLLERRYEFSQAAGRGMQITNLFPSPDLTTTGPYSLCAKCHDLSNVVANASFSEHGRHINDGFSCSVCHTAHGMGASSGTISGERMVNFDMNVVAENGPTPVSYSHASNSCSLVCHGHAHNLQGAAAARKPR